jgi:dihydroflavonol-4-reductase
VTVFITGGTGVVGRPLLQRLVADGSNVRALARTDESAAWISSIGADPVHGDIDDVPALLSGMEGAETVFHVAGINAMCAPDPSPMYRANVDGTRNVVRAANAVGVRRLIHTSSAVVLGEAKGAVGREDVEHRGFVLSHYERSKTLAEQVAFAESGAVEVISVNPSSVQGPGRATGTGKLLLDVLNGRLRVMVDTNLSIVDIDDCTEGHLLAWQRGEAGRRYILSGFTINTREAVAVLEQLTGRRLSVRYLPVGAAIALGGIAGGVFRMARRPSPVCREMVRVLAHGHSYDGSSATRELGLQYRRPTETIERTVDWFRSEGLLASP